MDSMLTFSRDFINKTGAKEETIPEIDSFPADNIDTKSIALLISNAFGFDRLNMVFTADYNTSNGKIKEFISSRKNPEQAKDLARSYSEFLVSLGGKILKPDIELEDLSIIEIMDEYEIIFTNGSFLTGIHSANDLKEAKKLAFVLNKKLKGNTHVR